MTEVRWRVYARVAAALALMLMLGDPAFQPGGTTRAQASSQAPPAAQAATAVAGQARPSLLVLNDLETLTVAGSVQTGRAPDGLTWVGEE